MIFNLNKALKRMLAFFGACMVAVAYINCSKTEQDPALAPPTTTEPPPVTRSFYMGHSPWPYDATQEAIDWTYQAINNKGDIVSQHIEEGVPWPEAFSDTAFAADYVNSLQARVAGVQAGKKVFLSLNPLNTGRNGLADYRGSGINMPLPAPWNSYDLNHASVKTAYLKYVKRMIVLFNPVYLAIGIEVNLLVRNNAALWSKYVELHRFIYDQLKVSNPELKVFASFDVNALLDGYIATDNHAAQMAALQDLLPSMDFLGVSLHPVFSIYHADTIPDDMFDKVFSLTTKPTVITESSYSAQVWTINVNSTNVVFNGSLEKQNDFTARLLAAAQKYSSPMVIGFSIRDFDALWNFIGQPDTALPWRDTGFYDEAGLPRPALATWDSYLKIEKK